MESCSLLFKRSMFTKSVTVLVAVSKNRSFSRAWSESQQTVLLGYIITVSTVVLNCCKGDRPSQWETPIF